MTAIKSFIILTITFILFTAIGTVSHEYGHLVVARYFGYETSLHYASINYYPKSLLHDEELEAYKALASDYEGVEYVLWPDDIKEKAEGYKNILKERYPPGRSYKDLFITLGGPLQTIFTGIIGLIILVLRRKSIQINGLKIMDWLAVFLGLFWLREIFNLIHSLVNEIIAPKWKMIWW